VIGKERFDEFDTWTLKSDGVARYNQTDIGEIVRFCLLGPEFWSEYAHRRKCFGESAGVSDV
jgi:hypothetical protein